MQCGCHQRSFLVGTFALIAAAGLAFAQPSKDKKEDGGTPQPAPKVDKPTEKPAEKSKEVTLKVGDKAPAITVDNWVKGGSVTGFEKGKLYVVEFWATWCPPCKESIPHLTKLAHEHKDVTFLGVTGSERKPSSGGDNRLENLEKFVKDQGDKMDYHVGYDANRKMVKDWLEAAGKDSIPTAFIIDGEGKIAWIGHPMGMEAPLKEALDHGKHKKDDKKSAGGKEKTKKK